MCHRLTGPAVAGVAIVSVHAQAVDTGIRSTLVHVHLAVGAAEPSWACAPEVRGVSAARAVVPTLDNVTHIRHSFLTVRSIETCPIIATFAIRLSSVQFSMVCMRSTPPMVNK